MLVMATLSPLLTPSQRLSTVAVGGWEYHSMETITVTEKPGCMQQPIP